MSSEARSPPEAVFRSGALHPPAGHVRTSKIFERTFANGINERLYPLNEVIGSIHVSKSVGSVPSRFPRHPSPPASSKVASEVS